MMNGNENGRLWYFQIYKIAIKIMTFTTKFIIILTRFNSILIMYNLKTVVLNLFRDFSFFAIIIFAGLLPPLFIASWSHMLAK